MRQFRAGLDVVRSYSKARYVKPRISLGAFHNNVIMDYRGKRLPKELREFKDTTILKQRSSPQLDDNKVHEVMDTAEELADSTEYLTTKLMRTPMFPSKLSWESWGRRQRPMAYGSVTEQFFI